MADVEQIIPHQIIKEESFWNAETQKHNYRYWHANDCLACALGLPDDEFEFAGQRSRGAA